MFDGGLLVVILACVFVGTLVAVAIGGIRWH